MGEEYNRCRAEPLQVEITDRQALTQQVSPYRSSQGLVVTVRYFPFWQLSQVLLTDPIFACLCLLQPCLCRDNLELNTWGPNHRVRVLTGSGVNVQGRLVPPPVGGAACRGTSQLRQALPEHWAGRNPALHLELAAGLEMNYPLRFP